ncbi:MAG: EcsC family protein [Bacteroidota bacterium]
MRAVREFVLDRLYPRAIEGLPGLGTPAEFAATYYSDDDSPRERGEKLVRAHIALSSATGFASGLGGWATLPLTLPANLGGVALIQIHMAASVAALAGKNPSDDLTRSRVMECLIGASPNPEEGPVRNAEQETWDRVGLKLAEKGLNTAISLVGTAASWGAKTAATSLAKRRLLRGIPLVGGFIGALSDGFTTRQVARNALDMFLDDGGIREPADFPPASGDGMPEGTPTPEPSEPSEA